MGLKVVIFGATGMIGAGALIECLEDPDVDKVLAVVRRPTGREHPRLEELIHADFLDFSSVQDRFAGFDACLFCLGVSAQGMSEADYRRITYDISVAAGEALVAANPDMRLCFISGSGTNVDSRQMWARVKGEAEQAMLGMGFESAHMFRPAGILPVKGVVSGVPSYRFMYRYFTWLIKFFGLFAPSSLTNTEDLGKALIRVARQGHAKQILEGKDINALKA